MTTAPFRAAERVRYNSFDCDGFGRQIWTKIQLHQACDGVQIFGSRWNGSLTLKFLRFHLGHREALMSL